MTKLTTEARCEGEVLSSGAEHGRDAWWDPVLESDDAPTPAIDSAPEVESVSIG